MGHGHDENRSGGKFQSVLFVCTGNIFRSVTAEYALKIRLGGDTSCVVGSAGSTSSPSRYMTGSRFDYAKRELI